MAKKQIKTDDLKEVSGGWFTEWMEGNYDYCQNCGTGTYWEEGDDAFGHYWQRSCPNCGWSEPERHRTKPDIFADHDPGDYPPWE